MITLDGNDIYDRKQDVAQLRARVGIVFQKPTPFPHSIYANVAYGPRIHGLTKSRSDMDELVHSSLVRAGLWEEVKDRLSMSGTSLSGGQQQRLCIARTIAVNPEVILMDEPTSALDPIASAKIEDLIDELRANYAIVIVTHNMQQAARVSQRTAYFTSAIWSRWGRRTDLHQSPAETDRRLHHRPLRVTPCKPPRGTSPHPSDAGVSEALRLRARISARCGNAWFAPLCRRLGAARRHRERHHPHGRCRCRGYGSPS